MSGPLTRLRDDARWVLGRPLTDTETASICKYLNLLIKWQRSQRLVSRADPEWIVDNVIIDSLMFTRALPVGVSDLCDVGSGAGIPGIPLRIVLSDSSVTLLEARRRRASFLSAAVRELGLGGLHVVNARLEQVVTELAGRFDAVVMRCAGSPESLTVAASALLRPGGVLVASGPPTASPVSMGEWIEVEGPRGRSRRLWRYRPA